MLPASPRVRRCSPTRCTRSSTWGSSPARCASSSASAMALLVWCSSPRRCTTRTAAAATRYAVLHRRRGARDARRWPRATCTCRACRPARMPSCGAPLAMLMKFMPVWQLIRKVLTGSGECGEVTWRFLGTGDAGVGADRGRWRWVASGSLAQPQASSFRSTLTYMRCRASMSATRTHSFDLVDRGVDHAELHHLRAERRDEAPVGGAAAGGELRLRAGHLAPPPRRPRCDSGPGGV